MGLNNHHQGIDMNSLRRMLLAASAAAMMLSTSAFAADANVAGEWDMTVETQAGTGNPHFSLKQDGGKLTGTYKGMLGESPVTGSVKGNEVSISFQVNSQGMDLAVSYTGTVEGATMKGTVKLGDMGEGTFTGKKAGG
jgi:opacity protein-like surface antigen